MIGYHGMFSWDIWYSALSENMASPNPVVNEYVPTQNGNFGLYPIFRHIQIVINYVSYLLGFTTCYHVNRSKPNFCRKIKSNVDGNILSNVGTPFHPRVSNILSAMFFHTGSTGIWRFPKSWGYPLASVASIDRKASPTSRASILGPVGDGQEQLWGIASSKMWI